MKTLSSSVLLLLLCFSARETLGQAPATAAPADAAPAGDGNPGPGFPERTVVHHSISDSNAEGATKQPISAPESVAPPSANQDSGKPIRAQRKFAASGELGWNSLSGLGANLAYHPIPEFAVELGAGLSQEGIKTGLRARLNLLRSHWTPVVAAGFLYGFGSGGQNVETKVGDESVTLRVKGSPYIQTVAGVNYTGPGGFAFMATAGWAFLLRENAVFVSGSRNAYDKIHPFFDGGVVVAVSLGYAF